MNKINGGLIGMPPFVFTGFENFWGNFFVGK
jgi:hypothetical protein